MAGDFDFSKVEGFDWDKGNLEHIKKHNVDYKECERVFFNLPIMILSDEKHSKMEERFKIIGVTIGERRLSLAITVRKNKIRVITARDQSKKERKVFEHERMKLGGEESEKT